MFVSSTTQHEPLGLEHLFIFTFSAQGCIDPSHYFCLFFFVLLQKSCIVLTFPIVHVCWWWILSAFICLKGLYVTLHFSVTVFFFQHCKNLVPLPSGLHYFCLWLCHHLIFVSVYVMCLFPLAAFMIFSLSLVLIHLIRKCLCVAFFVFLALGVHWGSCICAFIVFNRFRILIIIPSDIFSGPHFSWDYIFLRFFHCSLILY